MTENGVPLSLPIEFYEAHLKTINTIKFRRREMDIVAFMLNGRANKKIASFLSLSLKTVENYTHNLMTRLECNSRESIIDFIEKSDQLKNVRKYYSLLLIQDYFESRLKEIDVALSKEKRASVLIYYQKSAAQELFLREIEKHLKALGITVSLETLDKEQSFSEAVSKHSDKDYVIYALPSLSEAMTISPTFRDEGNDGSSQPTTSQAARVFFLFLGSEASRDLPVEDIDGDCLCLFQYRNYYLFFFEMLKKLLPQVDLEKTITDFNRKSAALFDASGASITSLESPEDLTPINQVFFTIRTFLTQKKWSIPSIALVCLLVLAAPVVKGRIFHEKKGYSQGHTFPEEQKSIQSDLIIPADAMLLERPELIKQIHTKFQEKPESIQTLALFGIGGSGKTTVARQYGRQQEGIVWEVNGETPGTLRESFENLAYALVTTDGEKNTLMGLKDIKNMDEKEAKLIFFVKEKLKSHPHWVLIFDNVERLNDIQNYFPSNPAAWGTGKVIVATRNSNIATHTFIHHALPVGELAPEEKLSLFTKITHNGNHQDLTSDQKSKIATLLNTIPSFPLDVSVAAHYLQTINIPYEEYIKNISQQSSEFDRVQNNVLNEIGVYAKTRYNIVTLSLKEIVKESKDFGEILLFISLLDNQNIPTELLDKFKDPAVRNNFIPHLKKYSLITGTQASSIPCLSIHRSTQDIALAYLKKELNFDKNNPLSQRVFKVLDDYVDQAIEKEDFARMTLSSRHAERLLDHKDLLSSSAGGVLKGKLGCIYYFINDHARSQKVLDESLLVLHETVDDKFLNDKVADTFLHIGHILTETGDYPKARKLFERSLNIYNAESPRNELGAAWALSYLGNVYRREGHFEKGKELLEESIQTQEKYPKDPLRMARTLSYLGSVYRWLGDYEKAAQAFKTSLEYYQESLPSNHFRIGWMFSYLGNLYRKMGQPESARALFEKGLEAYRTNLPEDHVNVGLMCAYLGNAYIELKDYEKAKLFLERGLTIYEKQSKKNPEKIAWVAFHLGKAYEGLKEPKKARELLDKSFKIYQVEYPKKGDIEKSEILRRMGEIYLFNEQLDKAEPILMEALKIVEDKNHPNVWESLETLGNLYEKQSRNALRNGNKGESEAFKIKSLDCLRRSSKIVKDYFSEKSSYFAKLQNRIQEVEKI